MGDFLRRYSIDELPQLWNVIKGEMSLVGPRPFFPEQREMYAEGYSHYIRVLPGITGMWQVTVRNQSEFIERAYWDEYYVRNWSIWLDVYTPRAWRKPCGWRRFWECGGRGRTEPRKNTETHGEGPQTCTEPRNYTEGTDIHGREWGYQCDSACAPIGV